MEPIIALSAIIFVTLFLSFAVTLAVLIRGFVFMKLWNWLIVPLWGFSSMSFIAAIAFMFIAQFIIQLRISPASKEKQKWYIPLTQWLTYYGFTLLIGWVLHLIIING